MDLYDPHTAAAEIDLDSYQANLRAFAELVGPECTVMAVVKADAYGHGMIECAKAARAAGVTWLGAATLHEGYALREAGDYGHIFSWLYGVDEDLAEAVAHDLDIGIHSTAQLARAAAAAATVGRTARVHLKIDTGLSRNGCQPGDWPELCAEARAAEEAGAIDVVAIWSHFAASEDPKATVTARQQKLFEWAYEQARAARLHPIRHFANTAATLLLPESRYEMVRVGIGSYGVDPDDSDVIERAGVRLKPVMRLRAQLTNVKAVAAGETVSYGATWTASGETTLGLVPMGYADGIPRHASNKGQVIVNGRRCPIRGRICMDQFVVDLGPDAQDGIGDEVTFFGVAAEPAATDAEPAADGNKNAAEGNKNAGAVKGAGPAKPGKAPAKAATETATLSASDWARSCGTIGYEIVTRIGPRVPRVYRRAAKP